MQIGAAVFIKQLYMLASSKICFIVLGRQSTFSDESRKIVELQSEV